MRWSDIPRDPPSATLRQFAGIWLAFFGGLALWQGLIRGNTRFAVVCAAMALTVGPLGLARPRWIRRVFVGWMMLAFPIGWAMTQVMLAVMFFGLFTPLGLVFRLIGRDPLHRARRPGVGSYWTPKPAPADLRRYFRQF
jgi:hypothetical protein